MGAFWEVLAKDGDANAVCGDVVTLDTTNSVLRSETSATIAAIGIHKMVVVVTRDVVFVAPP